MLSVARWALLQLLPSIRLTCSLICCDFCAAVWFASGFYSVLSLIAPQCCFFIVYMSSPPSVITLNESMTPMILLSSSLKKKSGLFILKRSHWSPIINQHRMVTSINDPSNLCYQFNLLLLVDLTCSNLYSDRTKPFLTFLLSSLSLPIWNFLHVPFPPANISVIFSPLPPSFTSHLHDLFPSLLWAGLW